MRPTAVVLSAAPSMPAPIVAKVFETAALSPDREALICAGERIGYGKLKAGISAAARVLEGKGVRRGDRVLLSARNRRPTFVYGYLACHSLGAIAVPFFSTSGWWRSSAPYAPLVFVP